MIASLPAFGPDWVSEACQELLVLEEAEGVLDAFGFDLDLLGSGGGGSVDRSEPDSLSVIRISALQLIEGSE